MLSVDEFSIRVEPSSRVQVPLSARETFFQNNFDGIDAPSKPILDPALLTLILSHPTPNILCMSRRMEFHLIY